jgi:hypothetical protein
MPAPAIPPPNPCAEKGRRLLELINESKAIAPIDEHNPLPGLQDYRVLLTEQLELVRQMQALRPGERIERMRKQLEAILEWNRWTQINFTDRTEETADAEKSANADFEASKFTDSDWQAFWLHVGPPLPAAAEPTWKKLRPESSTFNLR